jgi:hypothetical protein
VPGGAAALAVRGVDVGGHRVGGSGPWSVVDRIAPVSPQHGQQFAQYSLAARADPPRATSVALVL